MRGPLPRFPSVRLRGAIHLMKRQESDLPIAKSTYRERTRRRNVLTVLCLKRVNQLVKRFTAGRPLHRGVSLQPRKSGCFRIFPHYFVFFFFVCRFSVRATLNPYSEAMLRATINQIKIIRRERKAKCRNAITTPDRRWNTRAGKVRGKKTMPKSFGSF